jgi:hypothetical protein
LYAFLLFPILRYMPRPFVFSLRPKYPPQHPILIEQPLLVNVRTDAEYVPGYSRCPDLWWSVVDQFACFYPLWRSSEVCLLFIESCCFSSIHYAFSQFGERLKKPEAFTVLSS